MGGDWLNQIDDDVVIEVEVSTGAIRSQIIGVEEWRNRLKVAIAAQPIEGAANAELVKFFAQKLGKKRSEVAILRGNSSRKKSLKICGVSIAQIHELLEVSNE